MERESESERERETAREKWEIEKTGRKRERKKI